MPLALRARPVWSTIVTFSRREARHAGGDRGRRCRRPARSTARRRAAAAAAPKRSASGCCQKIGLLRHRQADLGGDDAVDLAHRLGQRALDPADVMHLLDERADPEAFVVEHRPFVAVGFGHAAGGELEPGAADLAARHHDDAPALGDLVGDVELLQLGQGAAALLAGEPGIEHRISRAPRPQDDDGEHRQAHRRGRHPGRRPAREQRTQPGGHRRRQVSLDEVCKRAHSRPLGPARLACS